MRSYRSALTYWAAWLHGRCPRRVVSGRAGRDRSPLPPAASRRHRRHHRAHRRSRGAYGRRAKLAGLKGDWAAHSLRSGFVTEAGRQGIPLGEVMAMTEHRGVSTVMGYFQAGSLLTSRAADLLATPSASPDASPVPRDLRDASSCS
ncbi:MAG TPA: tyrosine-type recombinase/integrase [Dyella sp.]|uniref:tyrosine-type recombinase/integrase n=1 Tax=Dyella sp. TaxID=1869338 RepID=UPI002D172960|nr:tyrosine-type recombinase/integrase [Dyella sp.]HUB89147.1 tyrosine-type recombinase/integrase [Dyella sp.]